MTLARPLVNRGGITAELLGPGDMLAGGEVLTILPTAVGDTWTAALIARGLIRRTGPGAGFTDTVDTAQNIITALGGNQNSVSLNGTSFRLTVQNTTAFALTFAAGVGTFPNVGTMDIAATTVREYLFTILNGTPTVILQGTTTNASTTVTFVLPPGMTAYPMGPAPNAINLTTGMAVSGTGIAANTTIAGLTQAPGGLIGVTLNQNATATSTAAGVALTFGPRIQIDSLRSSTL